MTTLSVRKVGTRSARAGSLGGESGQWVLREGDAVLATARTPLLRGDISIEAQGRRIEMHISKGLGFLPPKGFSVTEDGHDPPLLSGARITGGRDSNIVFEEWAVTNSSGSVIRWVFRRRPEDRLGFFDANGAPLLQLGHDPSFEAPSKPSTVRILFNFWKAAVASTDRYVVQVEDEALARHLPPDDVPVLALVGMYLERSAEWRYPSSA